MISISRTEATAMARRLKSFVSNLPSTQISHAQALDGIADILGHRSRHAMAAVYAQEDKKAGSKSKANHSQQPQLSYETLQQVISWHARYHTGLSSETMAAHLTGNAHHRPSHPHDSGDFKRCVQLLHTAPGLREHLHRMSELDKTWEALVHHWSLLEASLLQETSLDDEGGGPATSALISAIDRQVRLGIAPAEMNLPIANMIQSTVHEGRIYKAIPPSKGMSGSTSFIVTEYDNRQQLPVQVLLADLLDPKMFNDLVAEIETTGLASGPLAIKILQPQTRRHNSARSWLEAFFQAAMAHPETTELKLQHTPDVRLFQLPTGTYLIEEVIMGWNEGYKRVTPVNERRRDEDIASSIDERDFLALFGADKHRHIAHLYDEPESEFK